MRLSTAVLTLSALALALPAAEVSAETTRTIRLELPAADAGLFAVENLAGTMRVAPGTGSVLVAIATIHAEDEDLANAMKFERVLDEKGIPTLRVRYPLDQEDSIRYPSRRSEDHGFLESFFGGSNTRTKYDGEQVKVSDHQGVLLYADVEVQVPRQRLAGATFRNHVGPIEGHDVEGKIVFDSGSGDVSLARVRGEIKADTGSGDVKANDVEGKLVCDTGSGNCDITGFKGEKVSCDVGSGDVTIREVNAKLVDVDTGSGDVHVIDGDIEEFQADTGSGDVRLESRGARLARVTADTGSGDVTLRLAPGASFEALADQGSGDINMGFKDAQAIVRHKEVIGYRRGDAHIKIDVDTGSGDLTIEPGA